MTLRLHKSGSLLHLKVDQCNQKFCVASAAADKTDQIIKLFMKETSGTIGYQLGQVLMIGDFSLRGFNMAIAELRKRRPAK